ncbi:MAG: transglutaminase-like domain-containing protein [Christensenellales bacterium]
MNLQALSVPLPQDIDSYIQGGQWREAGEMIQGRLKLDLPRMLAERLRLAQFFMDRLKDEYTLGEDQLVKLVRERIPDFSEDDFRQLRNAGWLDSRRIEGRRMYFEDTVASLLKANPDFALRAGKPLSPGRPLLDEAMAEMKRRSVMALRLDLVSALTLEEIVPGDEYRIHLPLPTPAPQQQAVQIIDVQPRPKHISRESAAQRTAYFEETLQQSRVFRAVSSFEQRLMYVDPLSEAFQMVCYPAARPPAREDLEEQAPHIQFTPYLKALARELIGGEILPVRQAKRFYDFITGQVLYSYVRPYLLIENGAEYAAVNLRGDCGLQALLFITLCRIAGIPARWQSGLYAAPGDEGSHDWAWFYTEPCGWLPADCSFGGAARRGGSAERREFYFGNLDPYRAVFNQGYMGAFEPERKYLRRDPYDNQSGEVETLQRALYAGFHIRHEVKARPI